MSHWQLIFLQSRVNGAFYRGDKLPQHKWAWPNGTWFQERLVTVRKTMRQQVIDYPKQSVPRELWV
jgi:hypothetical protein